MKITLSFLFFFFFCTFFFFVLLLFIPCHKIVEWGGYYGFMLDIRVSASMSVFSFQMITCNFTKLGMCIDIVEIWFEIINEQIFVNF